MSNNGKPKVEQVFLIHEDGRLISHVSLVGDNQQDEEIISGMLTAVKDLLTVVFAQKEAKCVAGPFRFEMGELKVILSMGECFYITTVIRGEENEEIFRKTESVKSEIQKRYGTVLSGWVGQMRDMEGVHEIITQLLTIEMLPESERKSVWDRGLFKRVSDMWSRL